MKFLVIILVIALAFSSEDVDVIIPKMDVENKYCTYGEQVEHIIFPDRFFVEKEVEITRRDEWIDYYLWDWFVAVEIPENFTINYRRALWKTESLNEDGKLIPSGINTVGNSFALRSSSHLMIITNNGSIVNLRRVSSLEPSFYQMNVITDYNNGTHQIPLEATEIFYKEDTSSSPVYFVTQHDLGKTIAIDFKETDDDVYEIEYFGSVDVVLDKIQVQYLYYDDGDSHYIYYGVGRTLDQKGFQILGTKKTNGNFQSFEIKTPIIFPSDGSSIVDIFIQKFSNPVLEINVVTSSGYIEMYYFNVDSELNYKAPELFHRYKPSYAGTILGGHSEIESGDSIFLFIENQGLLKLKTDFNDHLHNSNLNVTEYEPEITEEVLIDTKMFDTIDKMAIYQNSLFVLSKEKEIGYYDDINNIPVFAEHNLVSSSSLIDFIAYYDRFIILDDDHVEQYNIDYAKVVEGKCLTGKHRIAFSGLSDEEFNYLYQYYIIGSCESLDCGTNGDPDTQSCSCICKGNYAGESCDIDLQALQTKIESLQSSLISAGELTSTESFSIAFFWILLVVTLIIVIIMIGVVIFLVIQNFGLKKEIKKMTTQSKDVSLEEIQK